MATLSDFKVKFLNAAKWVGIAFAVLLGLFVLIKVLFFIKELIAPTPPPPPTASFGKLPKMSFPEGIKKNFTYTIDTLSGDLPSFPDRTNVYKMEKPGPDILAVERASQKVAALEFNSKPEQLSDILYRWSNPGPPQKSLVLNVNMASFNLYSSYLSDPVVLSAVNLPDEKGAITVAQAFLEALGLYPEDIDLEKTKTELFDINNEVLGPATSLSRSKLISVYFFQKNIDDLEIAYPNGKVSVMNLVVAGGEDNPQVVNARFFYQKVSDESETYPIKTAKDAFEELKKGGGYIASHNGNDLNISIKKVYLAFYIEGRTQDFLLPVVVFEGSSDFIAYIPAIKAEWINN